MADVVVTRLFPIMNYQEQAMWGSHLPALMVALAGSTGPVLELGVGNFSTPVLHAVCGALKRNLVSLEADHMWAQQFSHLVLDRHKIFCVDYFHYLENIDPSTRYGVAFIDHSPGGESRAKAFRLLSQRAAYVVVHDYHLENEDAISPMLLGMKWFAVTSTQQPPTLIASRDFELPVGLEEL